MKGYMISSDGYLDMRLDDNIYLDEESIIKGLKEGMLDMFNKTVLDASVNLDLKRIYFNVCYEVDDIWIETYHLIEFKVIGE